MHYLIPAPPGVDADNGVILISDDHAVWRLGAMTDNDFVFLIIAGDVIHVGEAEVESGLDGELNRLAVALRRGSTVTYLRAEVDADTMSIVDALFRLGPLAAFPGIVDVMIDGEAVAANTPV